MTAAAIDDDSSVLDWLELVEGTARERLIERLAQAHLSGESSTHAEAGSLPGVPDRPSPEVTRDPK